MIGFEENKFPFKLFPTIYSRLPIGGFSTGSGLSLTELKTELDARNVDTTHMNRLDENVSSPKQIDITTANGTFVLANNTDEQDVLEFTTNDEEIEITLDNVLLTQTTTIRVYGKTDGTTYRLIQSQIFPADFDGDNVVIALNGKGRDQKITYQSGTAEGATRDIPHARVEELRG